MRIIEQTKKEKDRGEKDLFPRSSRYRCDDKDPRKRGDPWITISTGRRRLRRDSNPVYRLLSASSFFETESALYDRVTAGASTDLFLFFLASSFVFFFLSRVHRFRAALQAQRTAERQGSDQPWPSTDWPIESVIKMGPRCVRCWRARSGLSKPTWHAVIASLRFCDSAFNVRYAWDRSGRLTRFSFAL